MKFFLIGSLMLMPILLSATSNTVNKLENDTRSLQTDLTSLQSKIDNFKNELVSLEQKLAIPSHVAHDLGNLDKSMTTVRDVSSVASVVPPIKSEAETIRDGIDEIHPPVKQSKEVMDKVADTVEPVRQAVQKAIDNLQKIESKISEFRSNKITPFYHKVLDAQSCVDKADPKHLACMQNNLDKASSPADVVIAESDKVLKAFLNEVNEIENLIKQIEESINPLNDILLAINILDHDLEILIDPFLALRRLLQKHFVVKFPYPNPHNIFKKKWFKLKLSGYSIIKGINFIMKEFKNMLKHELYKFAKLFGLKKLAREMFNLFDNPFKVILRKLHLKIKIKIPGLDKLKNLDIRLENPLRNIELKLKGLNLDFKAPTFVACRDLSKGCN